MSLSEWLRIKLRPYKEFLKELLSRIGIKCNNVFIIQGDVDVAMPASPLHPLAQTMIASAEQRASLGMADAPERLGRNELCFLVLFEGKIAGYAWLNTGSNAYIPEIEYELVLNRREAYQYDALIYPQFRRNNLHKLLITSRLAYLKEHGFTTVYGFISADNIISLKSVHAFGYVETKKIMFLRIFCFTRRWELPIVNGSIL